MRGWKGLLMWQHERSLRHKKVLGPFLLTSMWTVTASRLATAPLNHLANCWTANRMGSVPLLTLVRASRVYHLYPTLGRTIPSNILTFALSEWIKVYCDGQSLVTNLGETQSQASLFRKNFLAGSVAGGCCAALFYPVEAAQRISTIDMGFTSSRYFGTTHCLEQRYIKEGSRSFYRGMIESSA